MGHESRVVAERLGQLHPRHGLLQRAAGGDEAACPHRAESLSPDRRLIGRSAGGRIGLTNNADRGAVESMLDTPTRATQPFTGDEYLESIRDRREIYVYGERVKDVTTHPAFRNTARSIARLYDALHDERRRAVITTPTDTGSGGVTHKFFRVPRTVEDCVGDLEAIAEWARIGYGWMGRSPDYKAAFLGHARRERRLLRPVSGQRPAVVSRRRRSRSCTGTTRSSIRRWTATGRPMKSATCSCTSRRRRDDGLDRQRREGGRHRLGADPLQLHRPLRSDPGAEEAVRAGLRGVHGHPRRQADLPAVVRA